MVPGKTTAATTAWPVSEMGEGRSFAFVLSVQPTGQKQGEGEWAE